MPHSLVVSSLEEAVKVKFSNPEIKFID